MESRLPGRHGATYISAASGYHSEAELTQGFLLPQPVGGSPHNATEGKSAAK